ncbi:MAG: hypothetical protein LUH15_11480 [Tannerellaceae bacterium]|nr:hypothetical protein [Tannerellaceae bacterium]
MNELENNENNVQEPIPSLPGEKQFSKPASAIMKKQVGPPEYFSLFLLVILPAKYIFRRTTTLNRFT